jgi:hypothetical protein
LVPLLRPAAHRPAAQERKYKRLSAVRRAARIKEEAERAKRMRVIDARTQVHLFGNDWWEIKLAKVKETQKRDSLGRICFARALYTDVVHSAKLSNASAEHLYGREGVYAAEKRQLSKTEIKRLKLR